MGVGGWGYEIGSGLKQFVLRINYASLPPEIKNLSHEMPRNAKEVC